MLKTEKSRHKIKNQKYMGNYGEHHYGNISKVKIAKIIETLKTNGSTVTGNNPWTVVTHNAGVVLEGTWDSSTLILSIVITGKNILVPPSMVWAKIDPLLTHIASLQDSELL